MQAGVKHNGKFDEIPLAESESGREWEFGKTVKELGCLALISE